MNRRLRSREDFKTTPGSPSGSRKMLQSLITVFTLTVCISGENPAIQVTLNNKGLQYGKHVAAGWIQEELGLFTFPDISGKIIGIEYTLSGITIKKCDFPEPSAEFYQDVTGLKTSVVGLSVAVNGSWMTHLGLIHDGGSFDLAVFNVDVTSVVKVGKEPDGHLSVTSVSCDAQVGDVRIQFYGGASWIFQPFVKHFKGYIRDTIKDHICSNVEQSIVNLESHLQAKKVSFDVDPFVSLDLPLTRLPVIDSAFLNLGLKGEFYNIRTHQEPPFVAQPFTLPKQPNYMLSMGLSDFTVNSASFAYYSAGLLVAIIDDRMIPPTSPVRLNTSSMGPYVPQLPKLYPGLLMSLQVYAREVPMFSFQPGVVKLSLPLAIKAFAIQPNTTLTPLFKLHAESKFGTKMWIGDGRLKGSVTMDNFTLTLAGSEVGTVETAALETLMKMGLKMAVLPIVNEKLGKGFVLPRMKHVELVDSDLKVEQGFIAFASDAEVLPTDAGLN